MNVIDVLQAGESANRGDHRVGPRPRTDGAREGADFAPELSRLAEQGGKTAKPGAQAGKPRLSADDAESRPRTKGESEQPSAGRDEAAAPRGTRPIGAGEARINHAIEGRSAMPVGPSASVASHPGVPADVAAQERALPARSAPLATAPARTDDLPVFAKQMTGVSAGQQDQTADQPEPPKPTPPAVAARAHAAPDGAHSTPSPARPVLEPTIERTAEWSTKPASAADQRRGATTAANGDHATAPREQAARPDHGRAERGALIASNSTVDSSPDDRAGSLDEPRATQAEGVQRAGSRAATDARGDVRSVQLAPDTPTAPASHHLAPASFSSPTQSRGVANGAVPPNGGAPSSGPHYQGRPLQPLAANAAAPIESDMPRDPGGPIRVSVVGRETHFAPAGHAVAAEVGRNPEQVTGARPSNPEAAQHRAADTAAGSKETVVSRPTTLQAPSATIRSDATPSMLAATRRQTDGQVTGNAARPLSAHPQGLRESASGAAKARSSEAAQRLPVSMPVDDLPQPARPVSPVETAATQRTATPSAEASVSPGPRTAPTSRAEALAMTSTDATVDATASAASRSATTGTAGEARIEPGMPATGTAPALAFGTVSGRVASAVIDAAAARPAPSPSEPVAAGNGTPSVARVMTIRIDSPEHGALQVRMSLTGSELALRLRADDVATVEQLRLDRAKLVEALGSAGYDTEIVAIEGRRGDVVASARSDAPAFSGAQNDRSPESDLGSADGDRHSHDGERPAAGSREHQTPERNPNHETPDRGADGLYV